MEVRVLGPVEVLIRGTPVHLAKRQHRLILGILGIEVNRTVPSEQLIELLWPGRPPARPRAVLHSRLSELRALLRAAGDGPVHQSVATGDDGYVLRIPTPAVDAHRFGELIVDARGSTSDLRARDVLRQALGLWRGPVLGGWSLAGPAGALVSSLEAARLTAIEDLYEVELRLGNHRLIADELAALSAAHPTRDRLTSAAMLALHQSGRSAEAVSVYHQRRVWLSTELGVDPAPALQQLHVAVLRHDPALEQVSRPDQLDRPA
ncbi:AfsR/SARP family transcriptional regulator [Solwaraspora sp. WMMD791]|uniref:AfsR/SARP family transcriptional regulator n=1 Tax=Solwaraspora sp. WMMD791 TaxID=3016086 RepID=UPI00249C87E7|nr:AfsR/SARP family transcriptional regulator [Solwaraspora sp. WMMD791]WFE27836.1 AfsR/SARP family transcriptional regulator [Solwaraspora sp. WMMD791]